MSWSANSFQSQNGNANFSGGNGGAGTGSSSIMSDRSGPAYGHGTASSPSNHSIVMQDAFGNNISNSSNHSHHSRHSHRGSLSRASAQSSQQGGGSGSGGGSDGRGGGGVGPQHPNIYQQQQQQQQHQPPPSMFSSNSSGSVAPQQLQLGMLSHPSVAPSLNRSVDDMMDLDRETTPLASTASVSTASRSPSPESSPLVFPNDPPTTSLAQAVTAAALTQGLTSSGMPNLALPGSAFSDPQNQQQQLTRAMFGDKNPFETVPPSSNSNHDRSSAVGGPPTVSSGTSDFGGSTGAPPVLSADQSQALQSSTLWASGAPIDDPTSILGGASVLDVLGAQQVAAMYDHIPPELRDQWQRMLSDPFSPETFEVLFNMAATGSQQQPQQQQRQSQQQYYPGSQGLPGSTQSSVGMPGIGNPLLDPFGNRIGTPGFGVGLSTDTLALSQHPSMSNLFSSATGPVTAAAAGSATVGGGLFDPAIRQAQLGPQANFAGQSSQGMTGIGFHQPQQQQQIQGSGSFSNPFASFMSANAAFAPQQPQQQQQATPHQTLFAQQSNQFGSFAAAQTPVNQYVSPGMMAGTPNPPPLLSALSSTPGSAEFGSSDSMLMNPPMTPGPGSVSGEGLGGAAAAVKSPATAERPKKVPRPENSYFLYRRSVYNAVKAANPHLSNPNISKIISDMWRNEATEVKAHYKELSIIAKEEHLKQYPDYKYQPRRKVTSKAMAATTARKKRESIEISAALSVVGSRPPSVMPGDHDAFMDEHGSQSDAYHTPPMGTMTFDGHAQPVHAGNHHMHQMPPLSGQLGSSGGGTPPSLTIPDTSHHQPRPPSAGANLKPAKRPGSPLHMPLRTSHSISGGPGGLHPTLSSPTFLSTSETSSLRSSLLRGGSGSTHSSMRQLSDTSNSMMHLYQSQSHSDGSFDAALNSSMPALVMPTDQHVPGLPAQTQQVHSQAHQGQGQGQHGTGQVPGPMGPPHTFPKRSGSALSHEWNGGIGGGAGMSGHTSLANQARMVAGPGGVQQVDMQQQQQHPGAAAGGMGSHQGTPPQQPYQLSTTSCMAVAPPNPTSKSVPGGPAQWAGMPPPQQPPPPPHIGFGGAVKWPGGPISQVPTPTLPPHQQMQQQPPPRSLAQSLDPRAAAMSPADFANTLRVSLSSGQISMQDAQQLQQVHLQMYQQHQQHVQAQMGMASGGGFTFGGAGGGSGPGGPQAMMGGGAQLSHLMMPMSGGQQQVGIGMQGGGDGMGSWPQQQQPQSDRGQSLGVMGQQPQSQGPQTSMQQQHQHQQQQQPPPATSSSGWS